eukprot:COSAG01_NODE_64909_length_275_cov_0.534091_2_plen_27_part_01
MYVVHLRVCDLLGTLSLSLSLSQLEAT